MHTSEVFFLMGPLGGAAQVRFMEHTQALLHGDLHTGSILVTPESTQVWCNPPAPRRPPPTHHLIPTPKKCQMSWMGYALLTGPVANR